MAGHIPGGAVDPVGSATPPFALAVGGIFMHVPSCVYVPVSLKSIALESIDLDTLLCSVVPVVSVQSSSLAISWVLTGRGRMGYFGSRCLFSPRLKRTKQLVKGGIERYR